MSEQNSEASKEDTVKNEIRETLSELKELIKVATYLSVKAESERGKKAIKTAIEKIKDGDLEGTLEHLSESCRFLKEKIDEEVEDELMELKSRRSNISEKDYSDLKEIDRAIFKLEKAKERDNYKDIADLVFLAWNILKKKED